MMHCTATFRAAKSGFTRTSSTKLCGVVVVGGCLDGCIMCDSVSDLIGAVRRVVGALEPARVRADDAIALVEQFATLERLVAAGRTLAAGRVAETRAWRAR